MKRHNRRKKKPFRKQMIIMIEGRCRISNSTTNQCVCSREKKVKSCEIIIQIFSGWHMPQHGQLCIYYNISDVYLDSNEAKTSRYRLIGTRTTFHEDKKNVFVSKGSYSKAPRTGCLSTKVIYCLPVSKPDVWSPRIGRTMSPLKVPGKDLTHAPTLAPSSSWLLAAGFPVV